MVPSLLILGRQPSLGLAELESLYGADKVRHAGDKAALLQIVPEVVDFARLGGSMKLCRVLETTGTTKWPEIQRSLERAISKLMDVIPEGKITLGLSAYCLDIKPQQLLAAGLSIKKQLRADGRSVRLVPPQTSALNSAQVLHNKLTSQTGCEIVLIRNGGKTIVTRTVAEQDIGSYALRDRGRPKRDAKVGMLPPKLAQIMVNLAGKHVMPEGATFNRDHIPRQACLLDPFCGTGVILQEALLDGYRVYGTDLEPRMIDYSGENLMWFKRTYKLPLTAYKLGVGDAASYDWRQPVDLIASETYLGQPFSSLPSPEKLQQVSGTCNVIIEKFLTNIGRQIKTGTRLCLAVPAWQIEAGTFQHLPLIDRLDDLGYNRIRFEHVRDDQLIYYREGQIVARELLVLKRI